jgi:aminoglycoside phosphotransferase (APT) family kinase protein
MPVVGQRDPEQTRAALTAWLQGKLPDATEVRITDLVVPQSSGFSNETFLFDAEWNEGGAPTSARLVLRSQPQVYALFPEIDLLAQQYGTMERLGRHTDLPIARMRWAEPDTSVLGQPFFVMDRLFGKVPGDAPPYTVSGWLMDLSPEERHRVHVNSVTALTRVNRVDWRAADFHYLDKSHHGPLGPKQRISYFRKFHDWACDGTPHEIATPAWAWLEANWPDDGEHIELCWGDARPGNQMFDDAGEVIGLFDWEMVSLGNAESDLGWYLFLQRFHTDGTGVPLPDGMLRRDEIIAIWEEQLGRRAVNVDFYEALGGFHFTLVMMRIGAMTELLAPGAWDPSYSVNNPVAQLTKELIAAKGGF